MSKLKGIKKFAKTSMIFFIGTVLSKVVSFFMIPLYTKYVSQATMGEFDLIITYVNAIIPILYVEIWSGLIRFIYDSKDDDYRDRVFSSMAKVFKCSTLLGSALLFILYFIFRIKSVLSIYILSIAYAISFIYQFSARGLGDNIGFALSGIVNTFVLSLSNYILIVKFNWGLEALLLSSTLGNFSQAIILEFRTHLIRRVLKNKKDGGLLKSMIRYSFPLSINSISFWALKSSNKIVLNNMIGLEANGVYAISQKFSNLVAFVTTAFNYAWQDIAFSRKEKEDGVFYSRAISLYTLVLATGGAALIIFSKFVAPIIIHQNYSQAIDLIPYGILAAVANAVSNFLGNIYGAIKKTGYILSSTLICGIVNVVLSIILIKVMGIQGANIALLISFLLNIAIRLYSLNKLLGVKLEVKKVMLSIIISLISLFIFFI